MENIIVDVAELEDGRIEVIEFNPCQPGMFGLFACDPYAIAQASRFFLPEDLGREVTRRQMEKDPAPVPEGVLKERSLLSEVAQEADPDDEPYSDALFDGP
jgi:hypothetical protein